ncbi:MAG: lysine exporter LysO family protein [Porphyromonas somerae]|uniref:lysine exporter LysO family protein n=1 Tax=Porphyromonas somerae TaxID=322095 RepID=UPI0026EE0863|nr:lysine exporter LysO family protein [Porphyromonas somerae]MDD7558227.1 lysine exporter LysO family protein [Porphyromonas somerae]MDY3120121.1 lysine exporter LysO family protein [Porphyromonas somerae]MDY5815581.1 lysine exporter LysO family protein [Porphyromonas somerae]
MKSNLILLGSFLLGLALGGIDLVPDTIVESDLGNYLLYLLLFLVGLSVGNDRDTIRGFRELSPRLLALPFLTIIGSMCGGVVAALLLGQSLYEMLAVSQGLAYYSLSSILITEKLGITLGAIALFSNVFRELLTLLLAPLLVKYLGPLAPIAAGGATTMDVTLPAILNVSGKEYLVPAIYHGFVCDFSVPILVTLFIELALG